MYVSSELADSNDTVFSASSSECATAPARPAQTPLSIFQVFNALGLTYVLVIFLVKTSVLVLFYRLFKVSNLMRLLILLGIAFAALCCLAFTVYEIMAEVTCVDAASLRSQICVGAETFTVVTGAVNTAVDIYILVLPIAIVLRLQLTMRRKLAVLTVFAIGFM